MICRADGAKRMGPPDGRSNLFVASCFPIGNLPQRRPDLFLKRRSVKPTGKIEISARPDEIFIQLPEDPFCQLTWRVCLDGRSIRVLQRRDGAVFLLQLYIPNGGVVNRNFFHCFNGSFQYSADDAVDLRQCLPCMHYTIAEDILPIFLT